MTGADDTDRLLAYLGSTEGMQLTFEFMADIGGDPEEYGIDDVAAVGESQFGAALKQGLQLAGRTGLVSAEVATLAESPDVDWNLVAQQTEANLWQGLSGP